MERHAGVGRRRHREDQMDRGQPGRRRRATGIAARAIVLVQGRGPSATTAGIRTPTNSSVAEAPGIQKPTIPSVGASCQCINSWSLEAIVGRPNRDDRCVFVTI